MYQNSKKDDKMIKDSDELIVKSCIQQLIMKNVQNNNRNIFKTIIETLKN